MRCVVCGTEIPQERLEALPNTQYCVECSQEKRHRVFPMYSHKTAPELVIISANDTEAIRRAERANRRSR